MRERLCRPVVVGESRILHVQIVAAQSGGPAFLETPDDLRIHPPIVKRLRDRERLIDPAPGFEAAIHRFRLPFHKGKSAFRARRFPFVEKIGPVNLGARIRPGFVRTEGAGDADQNRLSRAQVEGVFPARHVDEILQPARFAIGR